MKVNPIPPSQTQKLTPPVEHNIKDKPQKRTRRPSMSSFFNALSQVESTSPNNPHALPTPVDMVAAARLVQEQFLSLQRSSTDVDAANETLLARLVEDMEHMIEDPPAKVAGVPQSYLDELERVPKKELKPADSCPICAERFLDDPFPLVVELPCHPSHRFDLDCVGPWLRLNGTCPMDRKDLLKKKEVIKADSEDEEEYDSLYA